MMIWKMRQIIQNSRLLPVLCGVIMLFLYSACKTSQVATTVPTTIMKTDEALFSSVVSHSLRFKTLSARLKLGFESPDKSMSSGATLKMFCDDRLQLSVRPLPGMEIIRLEVTTDSVRLIDRINKRFLNDSQAKIKGESPIDFNFYNLQALLTNRIFISGNRDVYPSDFKLFNVSSTDNIAKMRISDAGGLLYTFEADGSERLLKTAISGDNKALIWTYNKFLTIDKQLLPTDMKIEFLSGSSILGTLTLSFSEPEIDGNLKADFHIPAGYSQVSISQFINSTGIK